MVSFHIHLLLLPILVIHLSDESYKLQSFYNIKSIHVLLSNIQYLLFNNIDYDGIQYSLGKSLQLLGTLIHYV